MNKNQATDIQLLNAEVQVERDRCAALLSLRNDEIRLMAGELTANEMRTVQAILTCLKGRIVDPQLAPIKLRVKNNPSPFYVPGTREDWLLYQIDGASDAAKKLGSLLKAKLDLAILEKKTGIADAIVIRDEMYSEMDSFSDYGACDTDPEEILVEVIEKALGLTKNELSRF
jgi:hypothetical protein